MLLTCRICDAQNLVPNGGFEQYSGCPTYLSQLDSVSFWMNPSYATPDYYNGCSIGSYVCVPNNWTTFQPAHSGVAYTGILLYTNAALNWRENIEIQLTSPLIANSCYHFEMYINVGNICRYATDDFGVYFSIDSVFFPIDQALPLIPQIVNINGNYITDTLNWTLISSNYYATGGEKYLTIGNFKDDAATNKIVIDSNGAAISYLLIDDVTLSQCTGIEEQKENVEIKLYPNPFNDNITIKIKSHELSEIILYDITSRKILQQQFTNSVSLSTEQLAKGLYLYEVRNKDGSCKKGKVVKE